MYARGLDPIVEGARVVLNNSPDAGSICPITVPPLPAVRTRLSQVRPPVEQLAQADSLRQYRGREQPGVRSRFFPAKLTETWLKS